MYATFNGSALRHYQALSHAVRWTATMKSTSKPDAAAGLIIAQEAGALVTSVDGSPYILRTPL